MKYFHYWTAAVKIFDKILYRDDVKAKHISRSPSWIILIPI